jgi:hypothetical protein
MNETYQLELTPAANRKINELAAVLGIDRSRVLRLGIALLESSVAEIKEGKRIGSVDNNDKLVTEFVGIEPTIQDKFESIVEGTVDEYKRMAEVYGRLAK